ncbi:MAG: TrkH family potassium uptake protein [Syntrophobacteraceae bacterium]
MSSLYSTGKESRSVRKPDSRIKSGWAGLKQVKFSLSTLIMLSFMAAILSGTALLCMPFSTTAGEIAVVDALFTATSAVCVTGLAVVDTGSFFSPAGQIIILLLIQLGGLGVMTVSVAIFLTLGRKVSFKHRMIMQEVFAHTPREDIHKVVRAIFVFTAAVEAAGIISLTLFWMKEFPFAKALYLATFHSISAFCNAGFALFRTNFIEYSASPWLNLTICSLIILGGIGFPVVYEIYDRLQTRSSRSPKISVHTKSVLIATPILIIAGMVFFLWGEHSGAVSFGDNLWPAFFQSVTCRTAGFNTVDLATLNDSTLAFMMFLMFCGGSPGSCAGGVKTTTIALMGAFIWSRLHRRSQVNMFKKSIPHETVSRAVSLLILSIGLILMIFFFMLVTHVPSSGGTSSRCDFVGYLFETISAFGTVGLSMNVTETLNTPGKLLIVSMMLMGRVGILTFAYVIAGKEAHKGIQYSEQNLMIG